jgi:glycine hydroxymethyltransferase
VIGIVTSCSIDSDGFQLGQAYIRTTYLKENTPAAVFAGSARAKTPSLSDLRLGDKVTVPEPVTILRRFPKKK